MLKKLGKDQFDGSAVAMACFAEKSQQVHLCGAHHENGRRGARDRLRCDSRSPGKRLAVAATPIRARGFRGMAGCAKIGKIKKVRPVLVSGVTAPPSPIQPPSPLTFASLYIPMGAVLHATSNKSRERHEQGCAAPKTRKTKRIPTPISDQRPGCSCHEQPRPEQ